MSDDIVIPRLRSRIGDKRVNSIIHNIMTLPAKDLEKYYRNTDYLTDDRILSAVLERCVGMKYFFYQMVNYYDYDEKQLPYIYEVLSRGRLKKHQSALREFVSFLNSRLPQDILLRAVSDLNDENLESFLVACNIWNVKLPHQAFNVLMERVSIPLIVKLFPKMVGKDVTKKILMSTTDVDVLWGICDENTLDNEEIRYLLDLYHNDESRYFQLIERCILRQRMSKSNLVKVLETIKEQGNQEWLEDLMLNNKGRITHDMVPFAIRVGSYNQSWILEYVKINDEKLLQRYMDDIIESVTEGNYSSDYGGDAIETIFNNQKVSDELILYTVRKLVNCIWKGEMGLDHIIGAVDTIGDRLTEEQVFDEILNKISKHKYDYNSLISSVGRHCNLSVKATNRLMKMCGSDRWTIREVHRSIAGNVKAKISPESIMSMIDNDDEDVLDRLYQHRKLNPRQLEVAVNNGTSVDQIFSYQPKIPRKLIDMAIENGDGLHTLYARSDITKTQRKRILDGMHLTSHEIMIYRKLPYNLIGHISPDLIEDFYDIYMRAIKDKVKENPLEKTTGIYPADAGSGVWDKVVSKFADKGYYMKEDDYRYAYYFDKQDREQSSKIGKLLAKWDPKELYVQYQRMMSQGVTKSMDDYEIMISIDPVDVTKKSTGQDWTSCETVGSCFGWDERCGWSDDIRINSAIGVLRRKGNPKWIARCMIRWGELPDGRIDAFVVKPYSSEENTRYRDILRNRLIEIMRSFGYSGSRGGIKMVLPYGYNGYLDMVVGDSVNENGDGEADDCDDSDDIEGIERYYMVNGNAGKR